jgi:hypothetical protein
MEEVAKNLLFQAGFAGLLLLAAMALFSRMMKHIEGKDVAHERDRAERDERYIGECKRWREDVGLALRNNTTAMQDLCNMIESTDKQGNERFHASDKKLDLILQRTSNGKYNGQ